MLNPLFIRAGLMMALLTALAVAPPAPGQPGITAASYGVINNSESTPATPDSLSSTSTYYSVRRDVRRCVSPLCGGYFVRRVNQTYTRCGNRQYRRECYVAEIDWSGQTEVEPQRALLRGDLLPRTFGGFGNLGILMVKESWQAASEQDGHWRSDPFYRVRDRGVRCIAFPCPTHHEAKLNSTVSRNIAGVDLTQVHAPEDLVQKATSDLTSPEGVIVTGTHVTVRGPGGRSSSLRSSQFYLRAGEPTTGGKPTGSKGCMKTGCSNQICADEPMVSTCEWRPEYACYQKARCERQADGKCGFTKTPELLACLKNQKQSNPD